MTQWLDTTQNMKCGEVEQKAANFDSRQTRRDARQMWRGSVCFREGRLAAPLFGAHRVRALGVSGLDFEEVVFMLQIDRQLWRYLECAAEENETTPSKLFRRYMFQAMNGCRLTSRTGDASKSPPCRAREKNPKN